MTDRIIQAGYILLPMFFFLVPPGFASGTLKASDGHIAAFMIFAFIVAGAQARNVWVKAFGWYVAFYICFFEFLILFKPFGIVVFRHGWITIFEHCVYIFFGFFFYNEIANSHSKIENYYDAICIGAVVQIIHGLPQIFNYWPYFEFLNWIGIHVTNPVPAAVGTLVNQNFFSAYLSISLIFCLRSRRYAITIRPMRRIPGLKTGRMASFRINWRWFIPFIVIHLLLSKTSTAVASAVAGVIVYYGALWVIIIPVLIVGAVFIWADGSVFVSERYQFWMEALRNYRLDTVHLLIGHGPGISWGKQWHLHNDWLQLFWQFGMTGIYIIIGYVLNIYRGNRILFAAFVAVCINMIGNFPVHLAPSAFLIIMILGLIEREKENGRRISCLE
jgi:hypothetical protein